MHAPEPSFIARRLGQMTIFAFALAGMFPAHGQLPDTKAATEKQTLSKPEDATQWVVAESTMSSSTERHKPGRASLHWHVTVDYFAGEPKYPIGWPRAHVAFKDAARDWTGWDFLLLRVWTDTSRAALPLDPVGITLYNPDKHDAYQRSLTELKKGDWTEIWIPLAKVPRLQDVRLLQLHLSESKYRHQDTVDLFFDEIALVRYAEPMLQNFGPEQAVMFADVRRIPVQFELLGTRNDQVVELDCELRSSGKLFATMAAQARRGPHRVVLDLLHPCPPGDYELVAKARSGKQSATGKLRLVESPWQGGAQ